jgi:sigma-E factor negative regulatory protein RseC
MNNTAGSETIKHEGIVTKTNGESVTVTIISSTACSGCHAEGSCSMAGSTEKEIEVIGNYNVGIGDHVSVLMKESMGFAALFLGYIFPLIAVILVLIVLVSSGIHELPAGLISVSVLIPYYLIIWLLRRKINDKFTFTLKV